MSTPMPVATLIITNFHLYLIQLGWQFFQKFSKSVLKLGRYCPWKTVSSHLNKFLHRGWAQTRVLHVVDLFVFCGILASFLDWISSSVTVSDPSHGILLIFKQVGRKILGAKIEIVNCLPVVCSRKWRFKIVFLKLNCCNAAKATFVWVINGSTSDAESLDTAKLFGLFLAFTIEQLIRNATLKN